jgi:hypothetical protein
MLQLEELDDRVPLADQLTEEVGPVINTFRVAPEDADALLAAWGGRRRPPQAPAGLHRRPAAPRHRRQRVFCNLAVRESVAADGGRADLADRYQRGKVAIGGWWGPPGGHEVQPSDPVEPVDLFPHPAPSTSRWEAGGTATRRRALADVAARPAHPADPRAGRPGRLRRQRQDRSRPRARRAAGRPTHRCDALGDDEAPGFATQVAAAVDAAGRRWVFDGAPYNAEPLAYPHADTVVALGYPPRVVWRRVLTRSVRLWLTRRPDGAQTSTSPPWRWWATTRPIGWAARTHAARHAEIVALFACWLRFTSLRQAAAWLAGLR